MPNRILKESICTSEDLDKLSPMAEILFYRLIVKADDYGAYYGNPSIIKGNCFPLKADSITCDQVNSWLDELKTAGLIDAYQADGREYFQFHKWSDHQRIRAKKRKYPASDSNCCQLTADDSNCCRNPIQIQSNTESNPVTEYPGKEDFMAFCTEHDIEMQFASSFYKKYSGNGWILEDGGPIRNWQNMLLSSWRKVKSRTDAETGMKIREHSYTLNDCVEYPPGSGFYVGREELEMRNAG